MTFILLLGKQTKQSKPNINKNIMLPTTNTPLQPNVSNVPSSIPPNPAAADKDEEDNDSRVIILGEQGCKQGIMKEFTEGLTKGVRYCVPQFKPSATAQEVFDALGKDSTGQSVLIDILNSGMVGKVRTKVTNMLVRKDGAGKVDIKLTAQNIKDILSKSKDNIVFSLDDAFAWNPGEREQTPQNAAKKLMDMISKGELDEEEGLARFRLIAAKARRTT
jgi:hypothetical protein